MNARARSANDGPDVAISGERIWQAVAVVIVSALTATGAYFGNLKFNPPAIMTDPYARPDAYTSRDANRAADAINGRITELSEKLSEIRGTLGILEKSLERFSQGGPREVRRTLDEIKNRQLEMQRQIYEMRAERTQGMVDEYLEGASRMEDP